MVKIVLLEGIATSGKSTIQNLLKQKLEKLNYSCKIVLEKEITKSFLPKNMTIIKSKKLLKKTFEEYINSNYDFVIFDRTHFSNISYFDVKFSEFEEIDNLLSNKDARIVWLNFDKKIIVSRIRNSLQYRKGRGFIDYFNNLIKNCTSIEEENKLLYNYFYKGILSFSNSIQNTKLKKLIVDVTSFEKIKDYSKAIPSIIEFILN